MRGRGSSWLRRWSCRRLRRSLSRRLRRRSYKRLRRGSPFGCVRRRPWRRLCLSSRRRPRRRAVARLRRVSFRRRFHRVLNEAALVLPAGASRVASLAGGGLAGGGLWPRAPGTRRARASPLLLWPAGRRARRVRRAVAGFPGLGRPRPAGGLAVPGCVRFLCFSEG